MKTKKCIRVAERWECTKKRIYEREWVGPFLYTHEPPHTGSAPKAKLGRAMLEEGILITSRKLNGYQFFFSSLFALSELLSLLHHFLLSLFYSSSRLSNEGALDLVLRIPSLDDSREFCVWIPVICLISKDIGNKG